MMEEKKYDKIKYSHEEYKFKDEEQLVTFGIHKGSTIGSLIEEEPNYIEWCLSNFKHFRLSKELRKKYDDLRQDG